MNRTNEPNKLIGGHRTARRQSLLLLTMSGLFAVIATACGSETTTADAAGQLSEATTTISAEPTADSEIEGETPPSIDATIVSFVEAFGDGDVELAFSFVSARCATIISENAADEYAAFVAEQAVDHPGLTPSDINAVVSGNKAEISYNNHDGSGEYVESFFSQPWILTDGRWLWDAC